MKLGINNLKNAALGIVLFGNQLGEAFKDKKFKPLEALGFIGALEAIPKSKEEWQTVAAEIKDLDADERAELEQFIVEQSNFSNEKVDACFDEGIQAFGQLFDWVDTYFIS